MRILVYLAVGFASACGLMIYTDSLFLRFGGIGAVLLLGAFWERKPGNLRRALVTLLGCLLGFLWFSGYSWWYLSPIEALDGKTADCVIRGLDYSRQTDYGTGLDGTMELSGKKYRVTAYLEDTALLEPGDIVSGTFRLRVTTDAGQNPSSYFQGNGVFLLAYQSDTLVYSKSVQTLGDIPAKLRRQITRILHNCIPVDCEPFAKALLLGDTKDLSYETDTQLKVSGIRHVVAVSGLHISVLFGLISVFTLRRRILSALAGIPLLFLFAAVAGFSPSVSRACVMCGLMMLGQMINKEYDGPTALSFAVLVMLLVNPFVIGSVSFQLSVASVAGIFLFTPGIRDWISARFHNRKGKRWTFLRKLTAGCAVTLGAQILTIPLCAYYFGMVSLVSVVTNLLVLWAVSLVFSLLTALCLIYLISVPLAKIVGFAASILIRYILLIAKTMSAFPLAAVYTVSPYIVFWLCFLYLLLVLYFAGGKRRLSVFACWGILSLCLALAASWWEPAASEMCFTVLDVGQGQCILMQSAGKTYVVDCGGDSGERAADTAAEMLLSRGYSRVDGLILTHTDRDHAGGAEYFLRRIPTDLLVKPAESEEIAVPEGTRVLDAQTDLHISAGDMEITVFPPVFQGTGNEMSLCVLFETEKCAILITGDRSGFGERSLLRNADLPDVDVLVAGHHGAATSTCQELLNAVRPEIVCISAGEGNRYGHPAPTLLERLGDFGCKIYRTDRQGTITIRR